MDDNWLGSDVELAALLARNSTPMGQTCGASRVLNAYRRDLAGSETAGPSCLGLSILGRYDPAVLSPIICGAAATPKLRRA